MGRSVSTPMANTTQSMTRCDNLQARCPARPVSNRTCSITAGEITLLSPASRSTTVSASGLVSKQLPCRVIVIASLKPGSYTDPRLQEVMTCAKTNGIEISPIDQGVQADLNVPSDFLNFDSSLPGLLRNPGAECLLEEILLDPDPVRLGENLGRNRLGVLRGGVDVMEEGRLPESHLAHCIRLNHKKSAVQRPSPAILD